MINVARSRSRNRARGEGKVNFQKREEREREREDFRTVRNFASVEYPEDMVSW